MRSIGPQVYWIKLSIDLIMKNIFICFKQNPNLLEVINLSSNADSEYGVYTIVFNRDLNITIWNVIILHSEYRLTDFDKVLNY